MFGLFFSKNARNSTLFAQKDQKSGNRGRNFDLKTDYKQSLRFISGITLFFESSKMYIKLDFAKF